MEPLKTIAAPGRAGFRIQSRVFAFLSDPTLIGLALVMITLALYWPATGFEFINYDDPRYVVQNSHIHPGLTAGGIIWAFSSGYEGFWQPLTWLSYMIDATLFGTGPVGFHLTNLLLHAANTVLVFCCFVGSPGRTGRARCWRRCLPGIR
jgi:hypothetical protein